MKYIFTLFILALVLVGCTFEPSQSSSDDHSENQESPSPSAADEKTAVPEKPSYEVATFAGGCFWCTEADFEKVNGVISVVSGYTGGFTENPTYKEASSGSTGHTEGVQVTFDPSVVSYEELLEFHWRHHDPTDNQGQFVDRGTQYRPGVFYHSDEQRVAAEASKQALIESGVFDKPVVEEITEFTVFYDAEEYHQDYYKKNPVRYKFYRSGSGRDAFLESVWKKTE